MENTKAQFGKLKLIQDHLHIRGEYGNPVNVEVGDRGSPPHTWRIHIPTHWLKTDFRITSTYVENTPPTPPSVDPARDHLHIRGEYNIVKKL